jgi:(E)-4-hydroxy-3-methylbut-2-enyl-diphosphate synthase
VNYFKHLEKHQKINGLNQLLKNPFEYSKRTTRQSTEIGSHKPAVVIADFSRHASIVDSDLLKLGFKIGPEGDWISNDETPDYIFAGQAFMSVINTSGLKYICDAEDWTKSEESYPYFNTIQQFIDSKVTSDQMNFVRVHNSAENIEKLIKIKDNQTLVLVLESENENIAADMRAFMQLLIKNEILFPVVLKCVYSEPDFVSFQIKSACDTGLMFIDGYADGIMIQNEAEKDPKKVVKTSFGILQASRTRMTKTEYISCPSCGRTLFEIQSVTSKLKKLTGHLKGLKLAVMGCIVNGIGEMADADYGYVGAGVGKVSLYKGKEIVKKNISSEIAIEELIQLIKEEGDWKDPE